VGRQNLRLRINQEKYSIKVESYRDLVFKFKAMDEKTNLNNLYTTMNVRGVKGDDYISNEEEDDKI
jgi:hypothetical protein